VIPPYYYWLETTAVAVVYSTVGAVVASRLPEFFLGWLFCTIGLLFGVRMLYLLGLAVTF
jgi:uncharacterized membrane protein YfcA